MGLIDLVVESSLQAYDVQGKLLYKNQPMSGALVTFHPKGADEVSAVRPTGLVKEDGTFTLATGQKEGAPAHLSDLLVQAALKGGGADNVSVIVARVM